MLNFNERGDDLLLLTWTAAGEREVDVEAEQAYRSIDGVLRARGAVPLQERVFGDLPSAPAVQAGRQRAVGSDNDVWAVPPTCVEGRPASRDGFAGLHVLAAKAGASHLVAKDDKQPLGRVIDGPCARFLGLSDVGRRTLAPPAAEPADEAAAAMASAVKLLEQEGFSYRDVARTWFYLRDILDWYGPFNTVRNAAFRELGIMGTNGDGAIPASTGIAGRNARGAWCTLDLVATRGQEGQPFAMERLHSKRQNEATEYGSAFARGMSLTLGGYRYVFVSGTASIDDKGATIYIDDFEAQLRQTLEVISAVLGDGGARFEHVQQATSFLKSASDLDTYHRVMGEAGLAELPSLETVADVCRDDLLFEMDATAVVPLDAERVER
jgi:enamine deaminase RidA (YjgF/YER057c/UK114 family)